MNNLYELIAGYNIKGTEWPTLTIGSETFTPDQIMGKTLVAAKPIPLKRGYQDALPVVFTVPSGKEIGVVMGFLTPSPSKGRDGYWWEFYDGQRSFFMKHQNNSIVLKNLKSQGALNIKEVAEKKEDEGKSWWENAVDDVKDAVTETGNTAKNVTNGIIIVGGVVLVGMMVSAAMRRNRRKNFRNFYREASRAPRRPRATRTRKS